MAGAGPSDASPLDNETLREGATVVKDLAQVHSNGKPQESTWRATFCFNNGTIEDYFASKHEGSATDLTEVVKDRELIERLRLYYGLSPVTVRAIHVRIQEDLAN